MQSMEQKEVTEGLSAATELCAIETPAAMEMLASTEAVLTGQLVSLSPSEKLAQFGDLESKCAEIEGRSPRAVESGALAVGDFMSAAEKVTVDSAALSEMPNLSKANLEALKKEVFSHASEATGSKNVAFKSIKTECIGCSGSCSGDCAGSTKCYSTKT